MEKIICGKHTFEIIDSVPPGYEIWNIGKNMIDGYLPLCRLALKQRFPGGRAIDVDSLKAIKTDGAQIILAAVGYGPKTPETMERYIRKHNNYASNEDDSSFALYEKNKIDSDRCANNKISEQEVVDNLEIVCDDVVGGILIFQIIPGLDNTGDFILGDGHIISKEFIS